MKKPAPSKGRETAGELSYPAEFERHNTGERHMEDIHRMAVSGSLDHRCDEHEDRASFLERISWCWAHS